MDQLMNLVGIPWTLAQNQGQKKTATITTGITIWTFGLQGGHHQASSIYFYL